MKAKKTNTVGQAAKKRIISDKEIKANKRNIKFIVLHCAATPPSMDVGRERIKKWHLERGFSDVGYHFIIKRNGKIDKGRDLDGDGLVLEEVGAHAKGFNSRSIGICWVGGVMESDKRTAEDNRTPKQLFTMEKLVRELTTIYRFFECFKILSVI
jgi:N-acetylmuramoyl-L-alanine amidase